MVQLSSRLGSRLWTVLKGKTDTNCTFGQSSCGHTGPRCLQMAHSCPGRVRRHVRSCRKPTPHSRRIRWSTRTAPGRAPQRHQPARAAWPAVDHGTARSPVTGQQRAAGCQRTSTSGFGFSLTGVTDAHLGVHRPTTSHACGCVPTLRGGWMRGGRQARSLAGRAASSASTTGSRTGADAGNIGGGPG
jgi:hypothetical protein